MDFDDLLGNAVRLLRSQPDVLERYRERFQHVLVDEYQDTNQVQNDLVMLLGSAHRNVCVVGDSDQSIYRFRGADIRNILEFERAFPDATVVVLDQNYRSSPDHPGCGQRRHHEEPGSPAEGPLDRCRPG